MKLLALLFILSVLSSCNKPIASTAESVEETKPVSVEADLVVDLEAEIVNLPPGVDRETVLELAGLDVSKGAHQLNYFATLCGSTEEWRTKSGSLIYIQGAFLTKEGLREKPYIIVIMKKSENTQTEDRVLWSGPNLFDGKDIYADPPV